MSLSRASTRGSYSRIEGVTNPSIYMLSRGVETWSKSLHKVGLTRKARVLLGLQGQTPGTLASGPWTPQNFLLRFPKTSWAFPFGRHVAHLPSSSTCDAPNYSSEQRLEWEAVTPSMRLYLPRVEAQLRGIIALKAYVAS